MYLCIYHFPRMTYCDLNLFSLLEVIKMHQEDQVLFQANPSVGTEGELQILDRSVRVFSPDLTKVRFCLRY